MVNLEDLELKESEEEETEMASWNHGLIQGQLYLAFKTDVQGYIPNSPYAPPPNPQCH